MSVAFTKDPDATLDYSVDWSKWLGDDTITASSWTVQSGLTKTTDTFTPTVAVMWVSGGEVGTTYFATNHITTGGGRQDDRTIYIKVAQR